MGIRRAASEYGSSVGDEQLAVAGTAVALASVPATAVAAMVTNGAEPIRVRWGTRRPVWATTSIPTQFWTCTRMISAM